MGEITVIQQYSTYDVLTVHMNSHSDVIVYFSITASLRHVFCSLIIKSVTDIRADYFNKCEKIRSCSETVYAAALLCLNCLKSEIRRYFSFVPPHK